MSSKNMTKEKFISSRRYCDLHLDFEDYLFSETEWGFTYDGCCYIEDTLTWESNSEMGRWHLTLENHYYYSDDLKILEDLLWNWAQGAVYGMVDKSA